MFGRNEHQQKYHHRNQHHRLPLYTKFQLRTLLPRHLQFQVIKQEDENRIFSSIPTQFSSHGILTNNFFEQSVRMPRSVAKLDKKSGDHFAYGGPLSCPFPPVDIEKQCWRALVALQQGCSLLTHFCRKSSLLKLP